MTSKRIGIDKSTWIRFAILLFGMSLALFELGCNPSSFTFLETGATGQESTTGIVVSTTFSPDGRLWRLTSSKDHVYVDYSTDLGATFSDPVPVNPDPQRIRSFKEDRPSIAVDSQGRVYVLYAADGTLPLIGYFSYSTDGGKQFSDPVPISDHADRAKHYQAVLALGPSDRVHVFWNDERDKPGPGASLFYAVTDGANGSNLPNQSAKQTMCECCRLAVDFDTDGLPVLLGRFMFPDDIRDHGMLKVGPEGPEGWRVTNDEWMIRGCPEHGPAFSIGRDGRYHISWFTQGRQRQGLFYAYSDDQGKRFSDPVALGKAGQAEHADVLALGQRVVLVWKEFDGEKTQIYAMRSDDRGEHWSAPDVIADSETASDHPFAITNGDSIFLSWNSRDHGYRLIPID